jgi:hypothetical protein
MPLDVSLEAIEAELAIASRGGQVADLAVRRAQVLATLLAAQPADHQGRHEAPRPYGVLAGAGADINVANGPGSTVYTVPDGATWDDRVTAAAMLLKIPHPDLVAALEHLGELTPGFAPVLDTHAHIDVGPLDITDGPGGDPGEPDEDDVDADFFAEAKRARRKK